MMINMNQVFGPNIAISGSAHVNKAGAYSEDAVAVSEGILRTGHCTWSKDHSYMVIATGAAICSAKAISST